MAFVPINDELALAVEDDVVVDEDFRFSRDERLTVTSEVVRPAALGNRRANPLLAALEHQSTKAFAALALLAVV
jgi:hypothetical protein